MFNQKKSIISIIVWTLALLFVVGMGDSLYAQPAAQGGGYRRIQVFPRDFRLNAKIKTVKQFDSSKMTEVPVVMSDTADPVTIIVKLAYEYVGIRPNYAEPLTFRMREKQPSKQRNGTIIFPGGIPKDLAGEISDEIWSKIRALDRRRLDAEARVRHWYSVVTNPFEKEEFEDYSSIYTQYVTVDTSDVGEDTTEVSYSNAFFAFFGQLHKPPKPHQINDETCDLSDSWTPFGGNEIQFIGLGSTGETNIHFGFGSPYSFGIAPDDNSIYLGIKWRQFKINYRTRIDAKRMFWGDDKFIRGQGPFAAYQPKSMVEIKLVPFSLILADWTFLEIGWQKLIDGVEEDNNIASRPSQDNPKVIYRGRKIDGDQFNWTFRLPLTNMFDGEVEYSVAKYQGDYYFAFKHMRNDFGSVAVDFFGNLRFASTLSYRNRLAVGLSTRFPLNTMGDYVALGFMGTFFQAERPWYGPFFSIGLPTAGWIDAMRNIDAALE